MTKCTMLALALGVAILSCNNANNSDEGNQTDHHSSADSKTQTLVVPDFATMEKNAQDFMTPGSEHKMMEGWNGTWENEMTMWMAPGAPEIKSASTATASMILNGLYQEMKYTGNVMGMPFEGIGITGFDNHRKVFKSTWIDNMGSGIMTVEGPWDEASKTIQYKGKMTDPATKEEIDIRQTLKIVDDKHQEMSMYIMMPDGKEFNNMIIKMAKK